MSKDPMKAKIKILKDGPYLVSGNVPLSEKIIVPQGRSYVYETGQEFAQTEKYTLCRCGHTKNPPYCDGAHTKMKFIGTETASREKYSDRAEILEGPGIDLMDDNRCAFARFCHREEGSAWELTERSDDPDLKEEAIKGAIECPAGRLVALDKAGNPIEPHFEPAIEVLQDPEEEVSGPLYVKGGIPVEAADGFTYEARNRITLCRCGKSCNKPFCDSAHVAEKYVDK